MNIYIYIYVCDIKNNYVLVHNTLLHMKGKFT